MKASRAARLVLRTTARLRINAVRALDGIKDPLTQALMYSHVASIDAAGEVLSDALKVTWQTIIERERQSEIRLSRGSKETILTPVRKPRSPKADPVVHLTCTSPGCARTIDATVAQASADYWSVLLSIDQPDTEPDRWLCPTHTKQMEHRTDLASPSYVSRNLT